MRIRPEIERITPYRAGAGIEEIARRHGLSEVVKLASNENPYPPFPEVTEAVADAAGGLNRYPEQGAGQLTAALSEATGVPPESLWCGAGSSELLTAMARALGGEDRTFVYPWPSFVMYRVNCLLGGARGREVPLDADHRNDLEALLAAIREDTGMVVVCNPNNPTGTYRSAADLRDFLDRVPDHVLAVVDEAYAEFAVARDYGSAIALAQERRNVAVARTFSKIYGLAGLRAGYVIGHPDTLTSLRKAQIPFSVNRLAAVAAITALRFPERVEERRRRNRQGAEFLSAALRERGIEFTPTEANFLWIRLGPDTSRILEDMERRGVLVRALAEEWTRVSIGSERENRRFLEVLDEVRPEGGRAAITANFPPSSSLGNQ